MKSKQVSTKNQIANQDDQAVLSAEDWKTKYIEKRYMKELKLFSIGKIQQAFENNE